MRHFITIIAIVFAATTTAVASNTVTVRGADISWCTEMEDEGWQFRNAAGEYADLFAIIKELGMNAVRLRVWVNPEKYGYGAWSDKADVIAKAKRAKAQGLDVMIDFHYSDIFADPGTQTMPLDWVGMTDDELKAALTAHTTDVLQALKDEGIEPKWVQVGNETISGMVWDAGRIDWNKSGNARYADYVSLSNVGYDAVKAVFPDTQVIIHVAGATTVDWFFGDFEAAGGKYDIMGVSHYPSEEEWSTSTAETSNIKAANSIKAAIARHGKPVMVCETGFSQHNPEKARSAMRDLFRQLQDIDQCAGVFYWEPQVDGKWKPQYYDEEGWGAYGMGAFASDGSPLITLDAFSADADYSKAPVASKLVIYDESLSKIIGKLKPVAGKEGCYSGYLDMTEAWMNFQVYDEEHDIWYGCAEEAADVVSSYEGHWNFWIPGDKLGVYYITLDLNTMRWTNAFDESGVESVGVDNPAEKAARYNPMGRRVPNDYKGIVIERGHKVLVR